MDPQALLHPSLSWPFHHIASGDDFFSTNLPEINDFSEDSSDLSSIPCFSSDFYPSQFPAHNDGDFSHPTLSVDDFLVTPDFNGEEMDFAYGKVSDSEISNEFQGGWSPNSSIQSSNEASMATQQLLLFLEQQLELDNLTSVFHLLKTYGEAIENEQTELANVIMTRLSEKVTLCGEPLLRLAFNFSSQQQNYLKQEAYKIYEEAFKAFYQIFPYGKFAHYAATYAILEAMPAADVEIVHFVDFDMGEGIHLSPLFDALAKMGKEVKLTAIKWGKCDQTPSVLSFEEAKRRSLDYAKQIGLKKLKMEEMGIEDLVSEVKRRKKRGSRKEWLVFNCMVGLPHMGRVRSRKLVKEFLSIAKELLMDTNNKGIITFGEGDYWENSTNCEGFGSFFEGNMVKYQALLESIEYNFPIHLGEGRMALECLFVGPYVSSSVWLERWKEIKEGCCDFDMGSSFEVCRISRESFEEAKGMVEGSRSFYGVKIGGDSQNEMILEWKGIPLLRFSAWKK